MTTPAICGCVQENVIQDDRLKNKISLDYCNIMRTLFFWNFYIKSGEMNFRAMLINKSEYLLILAYGIMIDFVDNICQFTVTDVGSEFSLYKGDYGCVFAKCEWSIKAS